MVADLIDVQLSGWTWFWLLWLGSLVVAEVVAALNTTQGDSLSEHVWSWASMKGKGKLWRVRRLALLGTLTWLAAHLLTGGEF